jgi:L-lactate dehydrogenase complex protein LldG
MTTIPQARAAILDRVRKALHGDTSPEAAAAHWHEIPRHFKQSATHSQAEILHLLKDRLIDYDAQVLDAAPDGIAAAVQTLLGARGIRRLVLPQGLPADSLPSGFDFVTDTGLSSAELDTFEGVITLATVAIAETGTVVLQNTAGQGRRAATLIPDYHLCIVHAADVVETVPEAIARLHPTASLATTFVSGPSATADIEMTRIKGVHGPRFLDVILVVSSQPE